MKKILCVAILGLSFGLSSAADEPADQKPMNLADSANGIVANALNQVAQFSVGLFDTLVGTSLGTVNASINSSIGNIYASVGNVLCGLTNCSSAESLSK